MVFQHGSGGRSGPQQSTRNFGHRQRIRRCAPRPEILLGVTSLILAIVATVKATEGGCYRYPLSFRLVK
jgi:uncharacterized protein DUF4870